VGVPSAVKKEDVKIILEAKTFRKKRKKIKNRKKGGKIGKIPGYYNFWACF
jgi:hypothetical protein